MRFLLLFVSWLLRKLIRLSIGKKKEIVLQCILPKKSKERRFLNHFNEWFLLKKSCSNELGLLQHFCNIIFRKTGKMGCFSLYIKGQSLRALRHYSLFLLGGYASLFLVITT